MSPGHGVDQIRGQPGRKLHSLRSLRCRSLRSLIVRSLRSLTRQSLNLFSQRSNDNDKRSNHLLQVLNSKTSKWSDLFYSSSNFFQPSSTIQIMTTIGRSERSERSALLGDVTTTAPVTGLNQAEPATSLCPSCQFAHLDFSRRVSISRTGQATSPCPSDITDGSRPVSFSKLVFFCWLSFSISPIHQHLCANL